MLKSIRKIIKKYDFDFFKKDVLAGVSVASLSVPQNMAYALVLGVNPIYGLYTSIVSKIIASFVGVSNYMIVGPTNLMSITIASNLSFVNSENYLQAVLVLTFIVGVFQFLFGLFKLGNLVNYVSHPVIVGLTTGTAIIIGIGQLKNLLGISISKGSNIFETLYHLVENLNNTNLISLMLGLLTLFVILVIEKINEKYPSYLLGIIVATFVVYFFNLVDHLEVVGKLSASLPHFSLPQFGNIGVIARLSTKALSVAIVGLIQTLAVVKSLENRSGDEVEANREFLGQGIINIITSFYSGFASAGSFTNSFVNYQLGGKTRIAELVSAILITSFIVLFDEIVKYIPIASLAALVIIVALRMIDSTEIIETFKATKSDLLIFVVTVFATILLPRLEYAIYLGVLLSLVVVVKESSKVTMSHMSYDEEADNKLAYKDPEDVEEDEFIVLDLAGDLNFSAADNFKEELNSITAKGFVIRIRNIDRIDLTSLKELEKFINKAQNNERKVLLSGVGTEQYEKLDNLGIVDQVGEDNIYLSQNEFLSSTIDAVESAENNNEEK